MRALVGLAWGVVVALVGHRRLAAMPGADRPAKGARSRGDRRLGAEAPLAVDLVTVALAGGLTPYLALELAARAGPPATGARFAAVLADVAAGQRLAVALEAETARPASAPLRPLLDALLLSERTGAPVAPLLARVAATGRDDARRAALTWARRLPVRLLFPLVFLILPAFLLLTVAPVLLAGAR